MRDTVKPLRRPPTIRKWRLTQVRPESVHQHVKHYKPRVWTQAGRHSALNVHAIGHLLSHDWASFAMQAMPFHIAIRHVLRRKTWLLWHQKPPQTHLKLHFSKHHTCHSKLPTTYLPTFVCKRIRIVTCPVSPPRTRLAIIMCVKKF